MDGVVSLEQLLKRLPPDEPIVWLDSARTHPVTGRWSLLAFDPWLRLEAFGDQLTCRTSAATQTWRDDPLQAFRDIWKRYQAPQTGEVHQRAVALLGFFSYDLNGWIETLPVPQDSTLDFPDLLWFGMGSTILVDHAQSRSWVVSVVDPHMARPLAERRACDQLDKVCSLIDEAAGGLLFAPRLAPFVRAARQESFGAFRTSRLEPSISQAAFESQVKQVLKYIRAGDIYQANLSQCFTATWSGDARRLYSTLRRINPSPFASFISDGDRVIAGCSPERLVRCQQGRIDTRPIAGTRARGASPQEDAVKSLELLLSEKERAEHIMLVDLMRNDLGRVCKSGSVRVNELMALEAYSHVMHIVSDVAGKMLPGVDPVDVVRAVFPGGTITGCPKVRCMEILRKLERVRRGLYTGSVGYIGFDGSMDLNIAIRTLVFSQNRLSLHVGAGIVADSDPTREYAETLAKAQALMTALEEANQSTGYGNAAVCSS